MGRPGQRVGLPMKSALAVLDGKVKAGEDFQPPKNHPGWGLQGSDPRECPVVSA